MLTRHWCDCWRKNLKKSIFVLFGIISQVFNAYGNDYKNLQISEGISYSGKVNISSGTKRYHNIWEIETNSIKTDKKIITVHILDNTKVYSDYNKTVEDEYTQFIVDKDCEFLTSGKSANGWIYIRLIENAYRWIPVDKVSFVTGSLNDLPELIFEEEYSSDFSSIQFIKDYIQIEAIDGFYGFSNDYEINEILPCSKISDGKITYVTFNNEKFLMMKNESLLYFINKNNKEIFFGVNGVSPRRLEVFGYSIPEIFSASSGLKEKDRTYSAKNLDNVNGAFPWVEGATDAGIGEYININYDDISALIISNGYVNFDKPYLYENNNRVKKFEVYNQDRRKIQEINLKDTPDPQIFKIVEPTKSIKLVIKEVYKGNKWDDTCVNFVKIIPGFCSLEGFVLDN